jgi:Flp pilus assembly protein TadG
LALVALAIFSIIAMAAVSIDVGTLYQASAEAQRAADAAALAAARVLSLSGMTGDPANSSVKWAAACDAATQVATAVANQNSVGGAMPSKVDVSFIGGDKGKGSGCSADTLVSFGVNPTVTVKVTQSSLSTYFSRIWGRTGSSVGATATAEVFNPSNSGTYASGGSLVPVQPRCVKPWIVPNLDPMHPASCIGANCNSFVGTVAGPTEGSISNPGILLSGVGTGVIGEQFTLVPDCGTNPGTCKVASDIPSDPPTVSPAGSLQYVPGQVLGSPTAVPSCGTTNVYQQAIAGCDQSTAYHCGVPSSSPGLASPNQADLTENPGISGDALTAEECLIHQAKGQDTLDTSVYPYQITAGAGNPLGDSGSVITSSNSIVSLPIYDGNGTTALVIKGNEADVTIVGFLQVFIKSVNPDGSMNVTVLNVAGCGNAVSSGTQPLAGTSPVPIRLITPP